MRPLKLNVKMNIRDFLLVMCVVGEMKQKPEFACLVCHFILVAFPLAFTV